MPNRISVEVKSVLISMCGTSQHDIVTGGDVISYSTGDLLAAFRTIALALGKSEYTDVLLNGIEKMDRKLKSTSIKEGPF